MREIKFREYNSHWKKMYAPFTLINAITAGGISDRYNKHSIFMQYTGLKDKNGVAEVYEGDIIDIYGKIKGNIYQMDKEETDIIIQDFGGETWTKTYNEAIHRGLRH